MRKGLWAIFVILAVVALPIMAKDKDYQDGKLIKVTRWYFDKDSTQYDIATQSHISGRDLGKTYLFVVKVGNLTYGGMVEKNWGSIDEKAWAPDRPVKVRCEKKGGAVASRSKMFVVETDGKERETWVVSITDDKNNEYCGKRKCDQESAEKKLAKQDKDSD